MREHRQPAIFIDSQHGRASERMVITIAVAVDVAVRVD